MKPIWKAYQQAFPEDHDLKIIKDEFFPLVVLAYNSSLQRRPTWSEDTESKRELAQQVKTLARRIKNTEYDLSADLLLIYLDDGWKKLLEFIESDADLKASFKRLRVNEILKNISEGIESDLEKRKLAEESSRELLNSRPFQFVPNPGAKNAQTHHLIRELSLVFRFYFNGPRPQLLARLVTVVLRPNLQGVGVDEDMVKTSLKEWYRTYPHLKEWFNQPDFIPIVLSRAFGQF
jgi:hypothetical protein